MKKFMGQLVIGTMLLAPLGMRAQETQYEHAKHVQEEHDAHHHTKAKIVGGSAVGGAVVGGLVGGPKGAVIGAGVGAGGGLVANHARKQHDIHKREHCEDEGRCH
jgi:outer membrane lipoprotein SlyB